MPPQGLLTDQNWGIDSCSHNVHAWSEVAMLSKCVLCSAPCAGKGHELQRKGFTRGYLQRWLAGERATLWLDLPRYKPPKQKRETGAKVEKPSYSNAASTPPAKGATPKLTKN